jgi:hypothetical protein
MNNKPSFDQYRLWTPGGVATKLGEVKLLTSLEGMCGFADGAFLQSTTADAILKASLSSFFIPNGLPKLVVFASGSEFAGIFAEALDYLHIPFHRVAKENHKAVLNESFHRYLNKVEKIHVNECESLDQYVMGALFALYAWNPAPCDGTNIPRCFAAKGRDFPLPIDLANNIPTSQETGEQNTTQLTQHLESMYPLWQKQLAVMQIINNDRCERHRDLKNKLRNEKIFEAGDIVLVRKQVKSSFDSQTAAKLTFKARGPYRVLRRHSTSNSYDVQRLPFTRGKGNQVS